jgi:hypothetical protein
MRELTTHTIKVEWEAMREDVCRNQADIEPRGLPCQHILLGSVKSPVSRFLSLYYTKLMRLPFCVLAQYGQVCRVVCLT